MKLEITEVFRDKYTDRIYKIGETIEVDEARGAELLASGRVKEIKARRKAPAKKGAKKDA